VLSLKRLLDRSLAAQATLVFLLGLGITALLRKDEHPALWVFHSALYTGVAIAVLAVQRRRAARAVGTDADGLADLNRKIRHREVPQGPQEQAAMRRLVAEQLGQMERAGKWLPYWLGAMGLVAVGMFVLGAVSGSLLFPLLFAVGMVTLCSWVLWMRRRSLDRLRQMRQALRQQ
jgi:Flp pilus assembly protein TadB